MATDLLALGARPTFGGLATGLDTGALVEALMAVERRPLDLLQSRKSGVEAERQAFQTLNTRVLALRQAALDVDNLNSTQSGPSLDEELLSYGAASSVESTLTATASGNAVPGQYDVRVEQLAQVGREISAAYITDTGPISLEGQTLSVDYGGDDDIDITVGPGGASLQDLAAAINTDVNNGGNVTASVIYVGNQGGQDEYRLAISGTATGVANEITVTSNIVGTAETGFNFIDSALEQTGQDARLRVLGVLVNRDSNSITDALPGVTLNLLGTNDPADLTDTVTVTVTRDDGAIQQKLQTFVDAYNAIRDLSNSESSVDEDGDGAGVLSGNATLRTIEFQIQNALSNRYLFPGNDLTSFAQIGVTFDNDGRLSLDTTALTEALADDARAVRELLSGDGVTDGIATKIAGDLEPVVRSGNGILAEQDASLQGRIASFDDQILRLQERLAQREESLLRQFAALESTVAQLQAQSTFLSF